MAEKRLKSRIIHKHETEANWKQSSLIPFQGEIIVYDKDENYDYERIKIGDGVINPSTGLIEGTNVNDLPFANGVTKEYVDEEIENINLVQIVNSLPEEGLPNQIYLVPSSEKFDNTYEEYVWVSTNDTLKMSQGDLVGTINSDYSEWVDTIEWINLDNNFTPYGQYAPIDNRDNLYTYIDSFIGASAGLMLSDGTNYYSIYACDYNGGAIWADIKNNKLYVSYDGVNISSYDVTENTKIIGVSCYGEAFFNDQVTIYECIVMTEGWESVGLRHADLVDYATKDYVTKNHLKTKVVSILPDVSEAEENIIYMVEKTKEEKELLTTSNNATFFYIDGNIGPSDGENIEILYGDASYSEVNDKYTIYFEQYCGEWSFDEGFKGAYLIDGNTMVFNYEDGIYSNIKIYGKKPYYEEYLFINGAFEPVGPSLNNYATKDYVDEEIATFDFIKVVDSLESVTTPLVNRIYFVPKKSDDLEQENDLFDEYIWMNIGTEAEPVYDWEWITTKQLEVDLTNYVEKEDGKGLSTNDFTNADKTKLDSIEIRDTSIDGELSGTSVTATAVSYLEHEPTIQLTGKNLIKMTSDSFTQSMITVNLKAGTYTISCGEVTKGGDNDPVMYFYNSKQQIKLTSNNSTIITLPVNEPSLVLYSNGFDYNGSINTTSTVKELMISVDGGSYVPYKTDFTGTNLQIQGKNLLPDTISDLSNWTVDGSWKYFNFTLPIGEYTFSCEIAPVSVNSLGYFYFQKSNDNWATKEAIYIVQQRVNVLPCTFTVEEGYEYRFAWFGGANLYEPYYNFQIEAGSTATEYEPYYETQVIPANADGTVTGAKSIAPTMILTTDNPDVIINVGYYKNINQVLNLKPFNKNNRQIATIGDISNSELITIEDIDTICGSTISYVDLSEGEF